MSPKIKSLLSTFLVLFFVVAYFIYTYIAALSAVMVSPIGLLVAILIIVAIPYILYRIFLKIYS